METPSSAFCPTCGALVSTIRLPYSDDAHNQIVLRAHILDGALCAGSGTTPAFVGRMS